MKIHEISYWRQQLNFNFDRRLLSELWSEVKLINIKFPVLWIKYWYQITNNKDYPRITTSMNTSRGSGSGGSGSSSSQSGHLHSFLNNSLAIRQEIQRFESVHPSIYAIYDLIDLIQDNQIAQQIRDHVVCIEGECLYLLGWLLLVATEDFVLFCLQRGSCSINRAKYRSS